MPPLLHGQERVANQARVYAGDRGRTEWRSGEKPGGPRQRHQERRELEIPEGTEYPHARELRGIGPVESLNEGQKRRGGDEDRCEHGDPSAGNHGCEKRADDQPPDAGPQRTHGQNSPNHTIA